MVITIENGGLACDITIKPDATTDEAVRITTAALLIEGFNLKGILSYYKAMSDGNTESQV